MSAACPGPGCSFCVKTSCNVCRRDFTGARCDHTHAERHARISPMDPDRVNTERVEAMIGGRIEVDLADGDNAAEFLELVAKIIRAKKRIVMVVE